MRVIILLGLLSIAAALPAHLRSDSVDNEDPAYDPEYSPEKAELETDKFEVKDDNEYLVYPPENEQEKEPEDGHPSNNNGENHSNENNKEEEENGPEEEVPVIIILETNKPSFFANLFSHFPTFSWPPKFTWPSLPFNWRPFGMRQGYFDHPPYFYPQYINF